MSDNEIDRINLKTMRSSVNHYAERNWLTAQEKAALDHVEDNVTDKSILDIGVGGGRTVPALLEISEDYIGIDYVHEMVSECKRRFPEVKFAQGDARDMSELPSKSISLAMFSMNGISMVDHQGRLEILDEVYRILKPGGHFLFSTYNKDNPDYKKLFRLPKFRLTVNPIRFMLRAAKYVVNLVPMLVNRWRFKRHEHHTEEYSIVNDKCHQYATMLYYICQPGQCRQLVSAGFDSTVLAFDQQGKVVDVSGTTDDSIFYVAQKPE